VLLHSDAVQGVGQIPVHVDALGVDLLSLTAHKMYGPKGVGALYVRMGTPRVRLMPQLDGGGHEKGRRSGTLNVPGIVGLGKACELAGRLMAAEATRLAALRERLRAELFLRLDRIHLNGHPTQRLPGNLNVSFDFVNGEALLLSLKEVAVSAGSACSSATRRRATCSGPWGWAKSWRMPAFALDWPEQYGRGDRLRLRPSRGGSHTAAGDECVAGC